ncbi:unnamed protein product [Diatraea saccharalis]|uniref:EGF-like domain-containing protein n=1 Tax=Diatraea saccharalis TaxID=40085 RepID=A0A9P0G496_9NEOP|nr:unnamed protein product [Diatraea saccharalis]
MRRFTSHTLGPPACRHSRKKQIGKHLTTDHLMVSNAMVLDGACLPRRNRFTLDLKSPRLYLSGNSESVLPRLYDSGKGTTELSHVIPMHTRRNVTDRRPIDQSLCGDAQDFVISFLKSVASNEPLGAPIDGLQRFKLLPDAACMTQARNPHRGVEQPLRSNLTSGDTEHRGGTRLGRLASRLYSVCVSVVNGLDEFCMSGIDVNENESIDATRIKREGVPENRDLTVLLVNDHKRNDNSRTGRYHSVKPLIGLLTSTTRTFIQDGVTTEFATQILGTTLDNGRIYAQLLTKSSLVLYNKPSNVDDPVIVKPTRIHSDFDGQWNVKQDLGFIDTDKFILKNTDYLAPSSKMDIVYASKPEPENVKYWSPPSSPEHIENQILNEPTARRVQTVKEIPRYVHNEALNFLDGPIIDSDKKLDFVVKPSILETVNTLHRQNKAYEPVTEPIKVEPNPIKEDTIDDSNIVKVKPDYDLPTFTIKNEFSPIFYYIDNVESKNSQLQHAQQTKLPKKLFGQKSEPRPKKTFTYSGFADFTTVVGDTVIIFSPNTEVSRPQDPNEVNVFPSARPVDKLNSKITFLAADIPVASSTYKAHDINSASSITTPGFEQNSESPIFTDDESLQKVKYDVSNIPDSINIHHNNGFNLNLDVIQPSETMIPVTESTQLTEDLDVIPLKDSSSQATEPLTLLNPSSTIIETSTESVVTEANTSELFTNSEEESENTAAEVTEKPEEEEEEEEEEDDEGENTTETEQDMITTTESGHSEESSEELEATTETKHDTYEDVICTDGLETMSTMTTEYKTLTYLTTYFIPLESTETTTSVKSDVVVESNVGYLTNVVCRSNLNIEPTAVISLNAQSSIVTNLEIPEIISHEPASETPTGTEKVTEKNSISTEVMEDEVHSTQLQEEIKLTTIKESNISLSDNTSEDENEPTTVTSSVITSEHISTSQSHEEVDFNTERSTTTTEEPISEEEDIPVSENEIDLIYKTLYTTYTYFTTFFGDQTSSVASHKSVITNIITSTIDLSKLDPTLLGAFNEDEIAPTSVGIGRPTETFAINSIIDLVKNKDVIESVESADIYTSQTPTPYLGDDVITSIKPDAVKTYFTTYTFFTTIYVGSDANVCSRSEVYTNYVGPEELIPTKSNPLATENTRAQFDFRNCKQVKMEAPVNIEENSSVESSVSMEQYDDESTVEKKDITPQPSPLEVDMLFSIESNPLESENTYVTDVKSSSSRGERKLLDNNNILEDQISSESNIEEIMPSPTLLLQTSYTTFTYFTTMYIGKDSSKIKSRLETITNVVTETIMPKKEPEEENNLPITYYTTFTYWTTLYKDKSTTITSREEIVSNVVYPTVQLLPTVSPIDTTPIDIDSVLPPKELEVELKPSLVDDSLEQDDGKATFYTTYTYFTTFYAGNTSEIRSSLETVTNIVDNTKVVEDNQLGRKVPSGSADKNLIQDNVEKPKIIPTVVKEEIKPTALPDTSSIPPTVLLGTYIDNLFAEVKPNDSTPTPDSNPKVIYSQVAVISGDSTVVTSDNKTLNTESTTPGTTTTSGPSTSTEETIINASPDVIESSVADSETTTETRPEIEEEDISNTRKKSRLSFTPKKPTFTPVIIPFASRNRPTFNPKRQPLPSSATTITRLDAPPTITATPTLKSVRPSGFGANRKQSASPGLSSQGRRFSGRSSSSLLSSNIPSPSRAGGFPRGSIQPTSRRTGFRSSSIRSNSLDYASRSAIPKIRPSASSRLSNNRVSSSFIPGFRPNQNDAETLATQQEESATEPLEEVTESAVKTTNNPLLRFRRPPLVRQPGTAIIPRSTTPPSRRIATTRGRLTTTTRRTTTRATSNPLLALRRQRPNALFPRRNLFRQPEPEPEEEIKENEQNVDESEELLEEEEDFEEDNDYDSSDRKERQVETPSTETPKRNIVSIRPFSFKRRTKRQVDYGNRKYTNFRRPGSKAVTRRPEPDPETEPPAPSTQKNRPGRYKGRTVSNTRTTTASAPKSSARQPFIIRGESRTTTTSPAYRKAKSSRASSRATTLSSRPKAPRLTVSRSGTDRPRSSSSRTTSRSRTRTTTGRASSRQRNSFENTSGERYNLNYLANDGKITVTHQIPTEVTIPVVNGKMTEYKNVLSATPSLETLLRNQISTTLGPLGNQQLVLAHEATDVADNGATKIIRYILHETPTTTVIFTPTTIRGRKTSYSHIIPSTVYNVEAVTQTVAPEIGANVPLANLLLSQLLLGNQQPAINPLLALQGQALLPQQAVAQTPITEYKTRSTSYVTTITDARETVLSITFKGKAILTTIVDPTTSVVTATEFITDTIVTTPTALAQAPQINSLLLPLLLQQQQQQQQALSLQTANPLLGLGQSDLGLLPNNNLNVLSNNDIYSNSPKPNILSDFNSNEDFSEESEDSGEDLPPPPPPPSRSRNRPRTQKPAPTPKMTSIVTLYVSGRHPGEFSTVLSTVVTEDTQVVRKREAIYFEDVKVLPSLLPSVDVLPSSEANTIDDTIIYGTEKYLEPTNESQAELDSTDNDDNYLDTSRILKNPWMVPNLSPLFQPPSRPGRDVIVERPGSEEDERRLKNLATKIMSNGVEVLVKDKNSDGKPEQRKLKLMHITSPTHYHVSSSLPPKQSLISSAVATIFNHQQISAMFPMHQLMQHNYIIKTCMTTYTYLTTVVQNKRSAISTFETIVSVVTTESLTNLYASDVLADIKPTKTKYMEVKTIQPTAPISGFASNLPKIEKRIDNQDGNNFDLIQPSEVGHFPCTTSCSCSHTKTEGLKTKYTNVDTSISLKYGYKTSKYGATKFDLRPTNKESLEKKTQYGPYEYETSLYVAPTDKIVEKYTEVMNDYSDEKDSSSVEESELLTNEQAPSPPKNKLPTNKIPDKNKPEKPQKPNKNKFVVADLLKLGSLGIKGLSQLAPVFEKMTGGFIKRQDTLNKTTTTTTLKPAVRLTAYNVNKRLDTDLEMKPNNFPIYIPVDELETSESQIAFTNATLHQNLAWAAEHKQPKAHIVPPKIIHESPLVNGGIPISPGEIITANSDVIVGKPAVGGPLTLAASGIKLQNPPSPSIIDSFAAGNEEYLIQEKPPVSEQALLATKIDDSFDLRPPEIPRIKSKPNRVQNSRPNINSHLNLNYLPPNIHRVPAVVKVPNDNLMKIEHMKNTHTILGNHGRPAFLDYIPSLAKPTPSAIKHHVDFRPLNDITTEEKILDNNPSSSEVVNTRVKTGSEHAMTGNNDSSKPFLVDIQPSKVANVLIPHGSTTALVFAGSSEPHKTGDYVDDPLPYPEPGYFGSFSIDAPQMTNVHNVVPNNNKQFNLKPNNNPLPQEAYKPSPPLYKDQPFKNDLKMKWKDSKLPYDFKIPSPISNQETHVQVGPHITVYNPDIYHLNNNDQFEKNKPMRGDKLKNSKDVIDKEYENYLAVPPPPPPITHFNTDTVYDNNKNKPHIQRPIIQNKPIQDMKVFLNIQHPRPNTPKHEQAPPKVTSEIYFAAQAPNSKPTPTYTIHIPPAHQNNLHGNNHYTQNNAPNRVQTEDTNQNHIHGPVPTYSSTTVNKTVQTNEINHKENTYSVTLNTATNVANNIGESGQVVGSSITVPIGIAQNNGQINTDIPISTNFAIRVEDDSVPFESYHQQNHDTVYEKPDTSHTNINVGDNRWNKSTSDKTDINYPSLVKESSFTKQTNKEEKNIILSSQNSHANFPMINDYGSIGNSNNDDIKPVTEYSQEVTVNSQQRPAKVIPNIPTNSHGWYSSVLANDNTLSHINNIRVDATTRKAIPLLQDYNKDGIPKFGQKISSIGKPPGFWPQNPITKPELVNFSIGKPFSKPETEKTSISTAIHANNANYVPYNFNLGSIKQPAYDIPIRDNSEETTTAKFIKITTERMKQVYENSEEIYDGEEELESDGELDGEVSQESMKIPVVSSSSEADNLSKSTTELTLLQEEVMETSNQTTKDGYYDNKDKSVQLVDFNPGTQTEKPFKPLNKSNAYQSNAIKPIYAESPYTKPRPFTINTAITLDHQLQQPHWQINQLMENSTNMSYEENLELNIGEEINTESSTTKQTPTTKRLTSTNRPPSTQRIPPFRYSQPDTKYKRPARPIFAHPKNISLPNESNIITSTVHIQDKKPLIVEKVSEKSTISPYNLDLNRSSSEIIDLSPPPPTMDYNFKPSTNDEIIMGMSPPPPRTPPAIRPVTRSPVTSRPVQPARTPPPYRTKPPRTMLPKVPSTQRPLRKPTTYRPAFDFTFNFLSTQLLPPPKEMPTQVIVNEMPSPTISAPSIPNVVFPSPVSSGWLTSSGVEFSSSFNFGPSSIQFPEVVESAKVSETIQTPLPESSFSSEMETSSEYIEVTSSEKPITEEKISLTSKEVSTEPTTKTSISSENISDSIVDESSEEKVTTDKMKVIPINNKNRTRKPYPVRNEDKKTSNSKSKWPSIATPIIKPTRTHYRPDLTYPTRHVSTRKIIRPIPTRASLDTISQVTSSSILESSETFIDETILKPTDILHDSMLPSISRLDISSFVEKTSSNTITPSLDEVLSNVKPTHHAGNEIKITDEVLPTKTEFKTTVVTLTKTLSEPPKIISSINYVNLTHTLTVTHTKTSLVSQSEGAVTQTLVLTNTHTSTVVDIVTEVHTQVHPTTIIETVTKHIPVPQVESTSVKEVPLHTKLPLDDISMSYEDTDNLISKDKETTENVQKIDAESESDNDTFFVVMNKSQNGGQAPPISTDIETGDYDGVTRNEQVNSNGVSQVLFGEILLAGTPFLETTNVVNTAGISYTKECQPDCKASRNERCHRIDGIMKCVCRPGFARMFPDRPCKPTYTYSVKLALGSQGNERLQFHESLSDNSSKQYHALALATHEGINRMVMQSDLRDVYHGVHITGFHPVPIKKQDGDMYQGVLNDFYVQLSDNAHESRLKEVIEKYLRNNNYSLGGTDVHAAADLVDKLDVSDFDECTSSHFHDCSEHAQCFNLRGTYTCSCLEGYADLSVNTLYPGRICSGEYRCIPVTIP